jgi:hypothetical protein
MRWDMAIAASRHLRIRRRLGLSLPDDLGGHQRNTFDIVTFSPNNYRLLLQNTEYAEIEIPL